MKPQLLGEDGVLAKVTAARGLRPVAGPRAPGGLARAVDARGNPWAVAVVRELDTDGLKILFRTAKGRRLLVACLDRAPSAVLAAARRLWVDLLDAEALERLPPAPAPAPAWEADARDHSATGDRLFALRDYEKALLHYRKAAEQDPAVLRHRLAVADALNALHRFEEEVREYDACLRLGLDTPRIRINRGAALHRLGRVREAITGYDEVLRRTPENPRALNNKGAALLALGRREEAAECLSLALYFDPDFEDARRNLALAGRSTKTSQASPARLNEGVPRPEGWTEASLLLSLGLPREALLAWERTAASDDPRAWLGMSAALQALGHDAASERAIERAVAGDDPAAFLARAWQLASSRRWAEADKVLVPLTGFRGSVARARLARARGDHRALVQALSAATRTSPEADLAWNALGAAELRLGNYRNALEGFGRALVVDRASAAAVNNRGVALWRLGRFERAREAFERAVTLNPDEAGFWVNAGIARARGGAMRLAERAFETAAEREASWSTPWAELARARRLRGDRQGAQRALAKAVSLGWRASGGRESPRGPGRGSAAGSRSSRTGR